MVVLALFSARRAACARPCCVRFAHSASLDIVLKRARAHNAREGVRVRRGREHCVNYM